MSHGAVALAIESTTEYRMVVVRNLYQRYLHRAPDAIGLIAGVQFLTNVGTDEQLAAVLTASPEYFVARGGGTVDGFLAALYEDIFPGIGANALSPSLRAALRNE